MKITALRIFLAVFVVSLLSVSANAQIVGEKLSDGSIINYMDINKKKQGKWIKKYDNGQVRYEGFFTNDIPSGTFNYYYENGKKKSILVYNDDHSSTVNMFWENGSKAADGAYNSETKRHGEWKMYSESGRLLEIINYVNGVADGNVKMYYPDTDRIVLDCMYANGKRNGYYKYYYENGNIHEDGAYKDNTKHGYWKIYTPDGNIEEEGEYVNGYREGEWKDYRNHKNGELVTYTRGHSDKEEEQMKEWQRKVEWARENQDKFMRPEDYLDNPMEFFQRSSNVDYGMPANTREGGSSEKGKRK